EPLPDQLLGVPAHGQHLSSPPRGRRPAPAPQAPAAAGKRGRWPSAVTSSRPFPSVNTTRVPTTSAPTLFSRSLRPSSVPPVETTSSTMATRRPASRSTSLPSSTSSCGLPVVMLTTSRVTGESMYGFTVLRATTYGSPVLTLRAWASGTALASGVPKPSTPGGRRRASSSAAASVSSVSPSRLRRATDTPPTSTTGSSLSTPPTLMRCVGTSACLPAPPDHPHRADEHADYRDRAATCPVVRCAPWRTFV